MEDPDWLFEFRYVFSCHVQTDFHSTFIQALKRFCRNFELTLKDVNSNSMIYLTSLKGVGANYAKIERAGIALGTTVFKASDLQGFIQDCLMPSQAAVTMFV